MLTTAMPPPPVEIDFLGLRPRAAAASSPACPLPILYPPSGSAGEGPLGLPSSPLTIFYDGMVSVFSVDRDTAEAIMRLAGRASAAAPPSKEALARALRVSYLPLARQRSLQRFLRDRRERLMAAAPYAFRSEASPADSDGSNISYSRGQWNPSSTLL